jgi:hypothetical protein
MHFFDPLEGKQSVEGARALAAYHILLLLETLGRILLTVHPSLHLYPDDQIDHITVFTFSMLIQ